MDAETKKRLDALDARVKRLEAQVRSDAAAAAAAARPQWLPVPDDAPATPASPRAPFPPAPAARPRPVAARAMLASNWLALAGILVLGLGVVFFLKLAYGRGWIPLAGRYAIGVVGGLALWGLGDALRRRVHTGFAQSLVAGGAAIAYITLYVGYASERYRDVLGLTLPTELALLAALAVLLAAYGLWRRFEAMGAIAAVLATVLLAPAGDFSTAGVLYAAFLDTALMLAALWRGWPRVVWTALAGANVTIAFGLASDVAWQVVLASLLVVNGVAVAAAARSRNRMDAQVQAGLAILLSAIETGFALDDAGLAHPFAWPMLAFGALGLAVALLMRRAGLPAGVVGACLLLAWPPAQFDGIRTMLAAYAALALVATAAGLAWPSQRTRLGARIAALIAWGIATLLLLAAGGEALFDEHRATTLALAAVVAAGALLQWVLHRRGDLLVASFALAEGLAAMLIALAFTLDGWAITVSWAALGVAVVVAGLAARVQELRFASFALFAFVLVRIFTFDIEELSLVGRVLAFIATGALLLVAAFLYARNRRAVAGQPPEARRGA